MEIEIANRLVQYRKMRGMSQEELASELGLSRQAVSKWERAEASPDTDNLIALARLYDVSLDTLLLATTPPQAVIFDGAIPTAPSLSTEDVPQDEATEDLPHYSYSSERNREELSPGAKMVIKIGVLVICIVLFCMYGFLSYFLPGLKGAYPLICTAIYLVGGFVFNQWHPGWLIYLTIPIYYTVF